MGGGLVVKWRRARLTMPSGRGPTLGIVRLDGYIRVSKVGGREGPSFISPQMQRDEIEAWARFKQAEILEIHTDLDESGGRIDRPGLERAVRRAERGETAGIVVAKLDRLSRSLTGALETIRRLDQAGCELISVSEGLDPTTPAGKMMMRLMLILAEFELDRIRETWNHSRARAVKRGVHISPVPPTGYLRGPTGRLVLDKTSAPYLAECFRMRAAYRSWPEIMGYVAEHGITNPRGESRWRVASLLLIMANRVYLGEARSGMYSHIGAHEPLIDRGTWEVVQLTRTLTSVRSDRPSLLSGLLRCAGCRHLMKPSRSNGANRQTLRYRCQCRGSRYCPQKCTISATPIESYVVDRFFELYEASPLRRATRETARHNSETSLIEAEMSLREILTDSSASQEESTRGRLRVQTLRGKLIDQTRSTLMPSPNRLRSQWPTLSNVERRRLLAILIDAVMLRSDRGKGLEDRVLTLPFGEAPNELPQRGRSIQLPALDWEPALR